jgi:tetratricopeptide (TPR) repeat protein
LQRLLRADQALPHQQRAVDLWRELVGEHHPQFAEANNNLAVAFTVLGRTEEARRHLLLALGAFEDSLGPEHPQCGAIHSNLGDIDFEEGKLDSAVAHFETSSAIMRKAYDPDHPFHAYPLNGLGLAAVELGHYEQARQALERVLQLRPEAPPEDETTAKTRFALARALRGLGRSPDRARDLATQALAALQTHPDQADELAEIDRFLAAAG